MISTMIIVVIIIAIKVVIHRDGRFTNQEVAFLKAHAEAVGAKDKGEPLV